MYNNLLHLPSTIFFLNNGLADQMSFSSLGICALPTFSEAQLIEIFLEESLNSPHTMPLKMNQ